jgi:hypothetical protein
MQLEVKKLSKEETEKLLATLPRKERGKYLEIKKQFETLAIGESLVIPIHYNNEEEFKKAKSTAGHFWNTFAKTGLAIVTQKNTPNCLYVIITKTPRQK